MSDWIRGRAPKEEDQRFIYAEYANGQWYINIGCVSRGVPQDEERGSTIDLDTMCWMPLPDPPRAR